MTESAIAISLPTLQLTEDEALAVDRLLEKIGLLEVGNKLKFDYYMGSQRIQQMGIAVPPHLRGVEVVVGWTRTVVDSLKERLSFQGWKSYNGDDFGLGDIYNENQLKVNSKLGHADALVFGTSFIVVGAGFDGEPNPLITIESARSMTGEWDNRTGRLNYALGINDSDGGKVNDVTLYTTYANLHLVLTNAGWYVAERYTHNLGRVLVAQLINNPMAFKPSGSSEITKALRYYVDDGVQTLLGMKINREFYSAPQRYLLGAEESMFTDADGNRKTMWDASMSRMLAIPANEDGENPTIGQFTAASPAPYVDQLKMLSQMVAAEGALPAHYLGFVTDNPASADAIRAEESRLIKRAEERQDSFERGWNEAGRLALLVRDGRVPDNFSDIHVKWRDPATPTRSAAADEVSKLVGAGILPPDSSITLERLGFDPEEIRQLETERRAAAASANLQAIRDAVAGTQAPVVE